MERNHRTPSLLQSCSLGSALEFTGKEVWISALLSTYCILLKDLHIHKSLPENKHMLYQLSFPKPATVWLGTNNPTFQRVLLYCWERTKPSAIKTPQKAKSHFFAALYQCFQTPAIFLDLPRPLRCFCHSTINCSWPFFFLSLPDHSQQHP